MENTKPIYAVMLSYIPYTCYDREAKIDDIYENKDMADERAYNYNLFAEKRRERDIRKREFLMTNPSDTVLAEWILDNPILLKSGTNYLKMHVFETEEVCLLALAIYLAMPPKEFTENNFKYALKNTLRIIGNTDTNFSSFIF